MSELGGKAGLRDQLLRQRRKLLPEEVASRSARLLERLIHLPAFSKARKIGSYLPIWNEVDVRTLHTGVSKQFFLPRLLDGGVLEYAAYDPFAEGQVSKGPRGILQPAADLPAVNLETLDLILVPGVGFDPRRYRLGMGAGYYDKTFARLAQRPMTMGLGFSFQVVPVLPADAWDIALDAVVTDETVFLTEADT